MIVHTIDTTSIERHGWRWRLASDQPYGWDAVVFWGDHSNEWSFDYGATPQDALNNALALAEAAQGVLAR